MITWKYPMKPTTKFQTTHLKNPIKLDQKNFMLQVSRPGKVDRSTVSLTDGETPRLFPPFVLSAVDAVCELTTDDALLWRWVGDGGDDIRLMLQKSARISWYYVNVSLFTGFYRPQWYISHYLRGNLHISGGAGFLNHQQYDTLVSGLPKLNHQQYDTLFSGLPKQRSFRPGWLFSKRGRNTSQSYGTSIYGDVTFPGILLGKIVSYEWVVSKICYFHPYLGKIPMLTNIFQRGWNHQLGGDVVSLSNRVPVLKFQWLPIVGPPATHTKLILQLP